LIHVSGAARDQGDIERCGLPAEGCGDLGAFVAHVAASHDSGASYVEEVQGTGDVEDRRGFVAESGTEALWTFVIERCEGGYPRLVELLQFEGHRGSPRQQIG
jgi:hypothetical protein